MQIPKEAPTNKEGTVEQYNGQASRILRELNNDPQKADLTGLSDSQKDDMQKISADQKSGKLTEFWAIDMATKVLEGLSVKQQYENISSIRKGQDLSMQYRKIQEPKPNLPDFDFWLARTTKETISAIQWSESSDTVEAESTRTMEGETYETVAAESTSTETQPENNTAPPEYSSSLKWTDE